MKTTTLAISFLATISISNVLGQGNGNVGIGTITPTAKLQVNHKSTQQSPTIVAFDSTGGLGSKISFRRQGSNQEFEISYDGANLNYNPKEVGVDKSVPWQFKSNGRLGFGTTNPQGRMQINHRSVPGDPAIALLDSSNGNGASIAFFKEGQNNSFSLSGLPHSNPALARINFMYEGKTLFTIRGNGYVGPCDANTSPLEARLQVNHKSSVANPAMLLFDSASGDGSAIEFRKQGISKSFRILSKPAAPDQDARFAIAFSGAQDGSGTDNANFILTGNGRAGFGANNPQARLQISHRSGNVDPALLLFDSTPGKAAGIMFQKQAVNNSFAIYSDGNDLYFNPKEISVDKAVPWQFKGSGRLGFGTPSPLGLMQVNHKSAIGYPAIVLFDSSAGNGNMLAFRKQGSDKQFRMRTILGLGGQDLEIFSLDYSGGGVTHEDIWNTSGFAMRSNGNIGMSTTTPNARLHINNNSTNAQPMLLLMDSATGNGNLINFRKEGVSKMFSVISTPSNQEANALLTIGYGADNWATFPSWLLALRGNGRAGFGTTNPSGRVQINHRSSQTEPTLILLDSTTGTGRMIEFRKENVTNSITFTGIVNDGAPSSLRFGFGGIGEGASDVLAIKGDGKVGINNTSPANALDVTGDLNFTGKLKVAGNTGVAGQVLTSNGNGASPAWQFPIAQPSGFNAYSDTFTVPASTVVVALPPNERFDNLNDYNANTGEFVAPQPSGYALNAHVAICAYTGSGGAQTMHWVLEVLNPNSTLASKLEKSERVPPNSPGQCAQFSIYTIQKLAAGQKVRLKVLHSFTGGVVRAIVDEFSAHRIL